MSAIATHPILAGISTRDLETVIIKARRSVTRCRLAAADDEAELHDKWMDIALDEWARRAAPQRDQRDDRGGASVGSPPLLHD
jgi:hypothetical protein